MFKFTRTSFAAAVNFFVYVCFGGPMAAAGLHPDVPPEHQLEIIVFGGAMLITGLVNLAILGVLNRVSEGVGFWLLWLSILVNAVWCAVVIYWLSLGADWGYANVLFASVLTMYAVSQQPPAKRAESTCLLCGSELVGSTCKQCPECDSDGAAKEAPLD